MSSIQEKMELFKSSCYEMAKNNANELSEEINRQMVEAIDDEIKNYKAESEQKYNSKIEKYEKNYNCQIYEVENASRHAIIEKEDEIKKDFEEEILLRINEFVKSEKYKEFLFNNIKASIKMLNVENGDIIKINITQTDFEKYKNEIEKNFKFEIMPISNSYIGGSICINEDKNISVNNTLKMAIEEKI